jgi:hypothetical protein
MSHDRLQGLDRGARRHFLARVDVPQTVGGHRRHTSSLGRRGKPLVRQWVPASRVGSTATRTAVCPAVLGGFAQGLQQEIRMLLGHHPFTDPLPMVTSRNCGNT